MMRFALVFLLAASAPSSLSAANASSAPEYTSSDVADAAERLTGRRAHMSGEIQALTAARLAGPAVTMRAVKDETASLMDEGLAAIAALEAAPEGAVIVVTLDGDRDHAVFGATFATLARSRRLGGFVIDGAMRGAAELQRLQFPTFARGTVPGSAGGHYRLLGVNVPIECGGVTVSPGDVVVADEDGVAVAPKDRAAEILAKARALRDEKEKLLPLIARYGSYLRAVEEQRAAAARESRPRD